jgi:hypothetical protein
VNEKKLEFVSAARNPRRPRSMLPSSEATACCASSSAPIRIVEVRGENVHRETIINGNEGKWYQWLGIPVSA